MFDLKTMLSYVMYMYLLLVSRYFAPANSSSPSPSCLVTCLQDSIVMYDRKTNRSRGFGFVTFRDEDSVRTVLSRDHEIMGKFVEIKRAEPRESGFR